MSEELSRRETLKRAMAAATVLALPDWMLPVLAQGEVDVPFTDVPDSFTPRDPNDNRRSLDLRAIDGFFTPNDQFFFIQHYNKPEIDGGAYKLKLTGLIERPIELSLADIKAMKSVDIVCGYECSGNSPRAMQGLSSNGRFTGVRLRDVLKRAGVQDQAREVVFFGSDKGNEEVVFRQNTFKIQQQFARSITLENAMKPDPLLAYALNGQPLDRNHGFPLRVIMPGWYGVANVKWLAEVHLQEARFLGNYQARWYRTLRAVGGSGEEKDPETQFVENEITRLNLKSTIARVRKTAGGDLPGDRLCPERRHAAAIRGSQGGRRTVAACRARLGQHQVLLEAVQLSLERRHAGRAHDRVARDRHQRGRAAHRDRTGEEADLPRGQQPVPQEGESRLEGRIAGRLRRPAGVGGFGPGGGAALPPLCPEEERHAERCHSQRQHREGRLDLRVHVVELGARRIEDTRVQPPPVPPGGEVAAPHGHRVATNHQRPGEPRCRAAAFARRDGLLHCRWRACSWARPYHQRSAATVRRSSAFV